MHKIDVTCDPVCTNHFSLQSLIVQLVVKSLQSVQPLQPLFTI